MKKLMSIKLQPGTALFLVISAVLVVLIFVLIWIVPKQQAIEQLDRDIAATKVRLDIQEKLRPLYLQLVAQSKSYSAMEKLPVPQKAKLPKTQIDFLSSSLSELARKSNLEVISIKPDVALLQSNPGSLLVNASLQGDFVNFRTFLVELGKIPYLETIGKIEMQQVNKFKRIYMQIWIAVG